MARTEPKPSGADVVADARRYLGIPYVFGGGPANPQNGLDCSGLVERVAFDLGIQSCPRTSEEQWVWSKHTSQPAEGDLVFFVGSDGEPGNPGHVAIVVSAGRMIEAPHTGTVVQEGGFGTNGTGPDAFVGYGSMIGVTPGGAPTTTGGNTSTGGAGDMGMAFGAIAGSAIAFLFIIGIAALIIFGAFILLRAGG